MRRITLYVLLAAGLAACGSGAPAKPQGAAFGAATPLRTPPQPKTAYPQVVAEYPHDVAAYTQGLLCYGGKMYESTGEYGRSSLREVDRKTGKVLKRANLPDRFFGEGLALAGDSLLYQLTWCEQRCLVYRLSDLKQVGMFAYQGEGWGLANRGDSLYMSDGSSWIRVIDPRGFKQLQRFQVLDDKGPVDQINELEWVGERLWANIYVTGRIAVIDPQTGFVTHYIDCSGLQTRIDITQGTDVFNGIAVDADGRIFVTGKRWNKLFEIKVKL